MRIYVGNLNFETSPATIEAEFGRFGNIQEVHVPSDRETGRPRGFAFVSMPDDDAAEKAIQSLNGVELEGRTLNVNEARPRGGGGNGYGRHGRNGW
ncbi:MAG: RNA-binding protein [Phycisphaera sp.]|nr:RNA-binding protein [Phycisphaera sp.]